MDISFQWIKIKENFSAYVSKPAKPKNMGIILLQEIYGVNESIRKVADSYAADGFLVITPDMFWRQEERIELGYVGDDQKKAKTLMSNTDLDLAVSDIADVAHYMREHYQIEKIATLGFCFGGLLSYLFAAKEDIADRAVCYYGGRIAEHLDLANKVNIPILFHHADQDAAIPLSDVAKIEEKFKDRINAQFYLYKNTDHGFNGPGRPGYNQDAAIQSRKHSLEFLTQ